MVIETAGGKAGSLYECIMYALMSDNNNRVRFIGLLQVNEDVFLQYRTISYNIRTLS